MLKLRHRRVPRSEDDHLDRWVVSYADFITLLFAFFVVMYAISSLNEGKYKVLSSSLMAAFRSAPLSGEAGVAITAPLIPPVVQKSGADSRQEVRKKQGESMKKMGQDLVRVMEPLARQGKVAIIETERGITVEINDSLLFRPGQAELDSEALSLLTSIAGILIPTDFPVTIEGHTDNLPIKTHQFPSNWELSAFRATRVLRLFTDTGMASHRLTAIGYGDQRPVAANDTLSGRAKNRRVNILIDAEIIDFNGVDRRREADLKKTN